MNDDKELETIFEELPEAMVSRLISPDMVLKVQRIGEMHALPTDQIEILQTIMALAFLGKLSFDDIDQEIEDTIIAPDAQLAGIKKDIEDQIIIPFINELKEESGEAPISANPDRPTSRKVQEEINEDAEIEKMLNNAQSTASSSAQSRNIGTPLDDAAIMPLVVPSNTQPRPVLVSTPTIIDSRLNTTTSLPKENMIITSPPNTSSQDLKQTTENKNLETVQKKPYDGIDPYREPLA